MEWTIILRQKKGANEILYETEGVAFTAVPVSALGLMTKLANTIVSLVNYSIMIWCLAYCPHNFVVFQMSISWMGKKDSDNC